MCHYISKTKDQKVLDNTYTRGKPYAFTVGKTNTTAGFAEAVSSMREGEKSSFIIPYQKLYGEQGIPGNLPQRSDLSFTINLQNLTTGNTLRDSAHLVATVAEEGDKEKEQTQEDNQLTHLTTYTRIAVEIIIKQSEPRITEISTATDSGEGSNKEEVSEEESHTEKADQNRKSDPAEEETGERTTKANNKEGGEAMEDKKKQTPSGSNIKRAFKTVASAIWPRLAKNNEDNNYKNKKAKKPLQRFLARTRTKHQSP